MHASCCALLTLTCAALAQSSTISPATSATTEGNAASAIPFGSPTPMRYQQIHSDLIPPTRSIRGIAFRQNGGTGTFTGTRTYDMELAMGASVRTDNMRFFFQPNLLGTPTKVVTRKNVSFGPQGLATNPGPSSFTGMSIVFDTPFAFSGNSSVGWDLQIHGGSSTGTFAPLDAQDFGRAALTTVSSGVGCLPTGGANAVKHAIDGFQCGTFLFYGPVLANGIPNAPIVLALGVTNPQLSIPGLCTLSYTELLITTPLGSCDALGDFSPAGSAVLRAQNVIAGGKIHSQIFVLDPNRADPFKLAGSNGIETTVPANTAIPALARIYTDGGTPLDFVAPLRNDTIGFGVVTRFDS